MPTLGETAIRMGLEEEARGDRILGHTRTRAQIIAAIISDVCELPDRTSPEDQPDMMLVTGEELERILRRQFWGEE